MDMMKYKSLLPHALIGLSLTVTACMEPAADETVSEATNQLSAASWGGATSLTDTWRGTQVATLNGVTYTVTAGTCGVWDCPGDEDDNGLHWGVATPTSRNSGLDSIPNQRSNAKVSLAAFNGYLYMVHTGTDDGDSSTWISHFDPAAKQWTANYQIPYPSFAGPPAIVTYNNLLYLIGTGPYPYSMWYATMTTNEVFSQLRAIPGHASASRPSAAVLFGKLYVAHRWGSTGDIVYGTFDGSAWTAPAHIPGGDAGGPIRGIEPAIAADNGILHLVHRRTADDPFVWWTYFDGCTWAASEATGAWQSHDAPSLAQGGPGLVMLTMVNGVDDDVVFGVQNYVAVANMYTHPYSPFPPRIPTCGLGVSP
jgi:hypothetical protein